jgi:hypothetical protein
MSNQQTYIHFTDVQGAKGIADSKELWASSVIEGVYAAVVGGASVPEVQQTRLGRAKNRDVAVYFTTNVLPDYCTPEECVWLEKKIPVKVVKVTSAAKARKDLDGSIPIIGKGIASRLAIPTKEMPDPSNPPSWLLSEFIARLVNRILNEEIQKRMHKDSSTDLTTDLKEAAITPEDIAGTDLAIFPNISSEEIVLYLFSKDILDTYIEHKKNLLSQLNSATSDQNKKSLNQRLQAADVQAIHKTVKQLESRIIIGMIKAKVAHGEKTKDGDAVWRISEVAAEKGYGPFMYEALMHEIGEDWLAPDNKMVSSFAKNVWKRFLIRPDIQKEKASNEKTKHPPEETALNMYYRLNSTANASKYRKLYSRAPNPSLKNPSTFFRKLGAVYFSDKYRDALVD